MSVLILVMLYNGSEMLSIPGSFCFDEINIVEASHFYHEENAQVTSSSAGCITSSIVPDDSSSLALLVQIATAVFIAWMFLVWCANCYNICYLQNRNEFHDPKLA